MSKDSIAKGVIAAAKARGLPRAAAEAAISTIIAECGGLILYANDGQSTLNDAYLHRQLNEGERAVARQSLNFPHDAVGRDLDSMGLFQQRPMSGWGPPSELMDPECSTGKFFDGAGGNHGLKDIQGWQDLPPWEAGRRVQGSLPKDSWLYSDAYPAAVDIVNQYWGPVEWDLLEYLRLGDDMADEAALEAYADKIAAKTVRPVFHTLYRGDTDGYLLAVSDAGYLHVPNMEVLALWQARGLVTAEVIQADDNSIKWIKWAFDQRGQA